MRRAFTLIELIVSVGVIAMLLSFSSLNFLSLQQNTTLSEHVAIVSSELRSQQLKAMSGETGGSGSFSDYGIYLANNAYIVFRGSSYDPLSPDNYSTSLPPTLSFTDINFANSQIVFQKGSGEILNYSNSANTFSLTNVADSQSKTFTLNALGVITQIQ